VSCSACDIRQVSPKYSAELRLVLERSDGRSVRVKLVGCPASRSASELKLNVPVRFEATTWLESARLNSTPALSRWAPSPGIRDSSSVTSRPLVDRRWASPELPPKTRFETVCDPSASAETTWTRPCGRSLNAAPRCELPER
jgi:hypothetical protein